MKMSDSEILSLGEYLRGRIAYARYFSNSEWHRIEIHDTKILEDGRLAIYLMFGSDVPDEISGIEFYNVDGSLFSSGKASIDKSAFPDGILYRYIIRIRQE